MSRDPLRFGLIGTGRIGQVHAASIAASTRAKLAWVADPVVESARAVAHRHGGNATDSPDEVIGSGEVDAILLASPTPTHVDLIEACVDAGIPVLCEKPIDLDIARVEALRPKVLRSNVPVALGFNQRFDPSFAEVDRRLRAGEIGALEHLSIVSRDPGPPPAEYIAVSGGIFRDMTIHDFDMSRFLAGDIVEVSAVGARLFDPGARRHGDFDSVVVTLRAASGALVTITNSRHNSFGYDQRLEVFGAGGMLQVGNAHTSLVSSSSSNGVESKRPYVDFFLERYAQAYARELDEFIALVHGEKSASPSFDDGRAALLIANAAQQSAESGSVVHLVND